MKTRLSELRASAVAELAAAQDAAARPWGTDSPG